jgi:hypothetical protein
LGAESREYSSTLKQRLELALSTAEGAVLVRARAAAGFPTPPVHNPAAAAAESAVEPATAAAAAAVSASAAAAAEPATDQPTDAAVEPPSAVGAAAAAGTAAAAKEAVRSTMGTGMRAAWALLPVALEVMLACMWKTIRSRAVYVLTTDCVAAPATTTSDTSIRAVGNFARTAGWVLHKSKGDTRLNKMVAEDSTCPVLVVVDRLRAVGVPGTDNFTFEQQSLKKYSLTGATPGFVTFVKEVELASKQYMTKQMVMVHQQDAFLLAATALESNVTLWGVWKKTLESAGVHVEAGVGEEPSDWELQKRLKHALELERQDSRARLIATLSIDELSFAERQQYIAEGDATEVEFDDQMEACISAAWHGSARVEDLTITVAHARALQYSIVLRFLHLLMGEDLKTLRLQADASKQALRTELKAKEAGKVARALAKQTCDHKRLADASLELDDGDDVAEMLLQPVGAGERVDMPFGHWARERRERRAKEAAHVLEKLAAGAEKKAAQQTASKLRQQKKKLLADASRAKKQAEGSEEQARKTAEQKAVQRAQFEADPRPQTSSKDAAEDRGERAAARTRGRAGSPITLIEGKVRRLSVAND